jgi:hypothetical protein
MKRLVFLVVFSLCFVSGVFALDKKDADKAIAGQKQMMPVKTIFSYQKELGLSDDQVKSIKAKLADFQKYIDTQKQALVVLQKELSEMLNKNESLRLIRGKFEQISRIQVDVSCKDIETSRSIEGVLSSSQLSKWKKLQAEARKVAQKQIEEAQKAKR